MNARLTGDPVAPRKTNDDISPQVEEIILHAMARNPQDRYPTALAMKHDLDHPEAVHVTGRANRLVEPSLMKTSWRRVRVAVLGVGIPLLVVGTVYAARHLHWQ